MTLAQKLYALRTERGMKQADIAKIAGVSTKAVSAWELGTREAKMQSIQKLCAYLHLDFMLFSDTSTDYYSNSEAGRGPLSPGAIPLDPSKLHQIPILGRVSAGLPLYAEQNIEGYTFTDLNGGAEYFALRISGDSMNAARINDGDLVIVRRQDAVEQGEIAVVMVDKEDATVKRFYSSDTTITLMPQSTNPVHKPQMYDLQKTTIRVLGKVVKVEFTP